MDNILLPKTQHLVVFQEVIRCGSIGSAAKQLRLTQPAVSKIINDVEYYFGTELMIRKNTGVTLTSAGQVLLAYAESITREMKNMVSEINSLSAGGVVDVSFGFPSLIQRNKVITEGAGALASAALLSGKLDDYIQNRKTVSIVSGGNIDLSRVSQITGLVGA